MAPMADMLNMGPPDTVYVTYEPTYFNNRGGFRMYSAIDYKKGDEIEFYYGSECRERLFTLYGFVTKGAKECSGDEPAAPEESALQGSW